jgi:hypothetical protein
MAVTNQRLRGHDKAGEISEVLRGTGDHGVEARALHGLDLFGDDFWSHDVISFYRLNARGLVPVRVTAPSNALKTPTDGRDCPQKH